ncbi:centromere protein X [Peziza echinospora]|nr:centromere protein X [Peziza echinospora]
MISSNATATATTHSHQPQTRISSTAVAAVGEYTRWFIKEAIARSVFERRKAEEARGGGGGVVDVEVEDLERVAPQLVLDF